MRKMDQRGKFENLISQGNIKFKIHFRNNKLFTFFRSTSTFVLGERKLPNS